MARTPLDAGVKIKSATVSPGADAAHYHYQTLCAKRTGWVEVPFPVEIEPLFGDDAEDEENLIVESVNAIAADL